MKFKKRLIPSALNCILRLRHIAMGHLTRRYPLRDLATSMRAHDPEIELATEGRLSGPLSSFVPPRIQNRCPHCHESFGTASLPIHIARCRSLLEINSEESNSKAHAIRVHHKKPRKVRSLIDLFVCLFTKSFNTASVCIHPLPSSDVFRLS